MEQTTENFKLILALIRTELSVNAMILALHRSGFNNERHVYDLSAQIMRLIGFTEKESDRDEVLEFYANKMNRLTTDNLMEKTEKINETVMLFYSELLAYKKYIDR